MRKALKIIRKIDVFGKSIELTFRQKKTHKTYFGAILTLCVVGLCLMGCKSLTSDFIAKENPDILNKQLLLDGSLETQNLIANLNISVSLFHTTTEEQYNIDNNDITLTAVCRGIEIPLIHNPSQKNTFSLSTIPLMNQADLIEISIKGIDIEKYSLQLTFTQLLFRPDIFSEPYLQNQKVMSFSMAYEGMHAVFQLVEIKTDRGYILPQFETEQLLFYKQMQSLHRKGKQLGASSLILSIDEVSTQYTRKYQKIQNILAVIGGLLKSLLLVGHFIAKPIQKLSLNGALLSDLFNFSGDQNESGSKRDYYKSLQYHESKMSSQIKQLGSKFTGDKDEDSLIGNADTGDQKKEVLINRIKSQLQLQIQNNIASHNSLDKPSTFQSPQSKKPRAHLPALENIPSQLPIFSKHTSSQIGLMKQSVGGDGNEEKQKMLLKKENSSSEKIFESEDSQNILLQIKKPKIVGLQKNKSQNSSILIEQQWVAEGEEVNNHCSQVISSPNRRLKLQGTSDFLQQPNRITLMMSEINEVPLELENKSRFQPFSQENPVKLTEDGVDYQQKGYFESPKMRKSQSYQDNISVGKQQQVNESQYLETHFIQIKGQIDSQNGKQNEYQNPINEVNVPNQFKYLRRMSESRIELPVLKKDNTQFVADLICLRAKEKTKVQPQNSDLKITANQQAFQTRSKSNSNTNNNSQKISNNNTAVDKNSCPEKEILTGNISVNQNEKIRKRFDKTLEEKFTKTLKLSCLDFCKYFACKNDVKRQQIKSCTKKIKTRLDIVYILNKLVEIDKLKMLLLDQSQRELFEFLPRPVVLPPLKPGQENNFKESLDTLNIQEAWSLLQEEKSTIDKATDACLAYKIMMQKQKKNVMDLRLLEMLDINIRHVFNSTRIPQNILDEKILLSKQYKNIPEQTQIIDGNGSGIVNNMENQMKEQQGRIEGGQFKVPLFTQEVGQSQQQTILEKQQEMLIQKSGGLPFNQKNRFNNSPNLSASRDQKNENSMMSYLSSVPEELPQRKIPQSRIVQEFQNRHSFNLNVAHIKDSKRNQHFGSFDHKRNIPFSLYSGQANEEMLESNEQYENNQQQYFEEQSGYNFEQMRNRNASQMSKSLDIPYSPDEIVNSRQRRDSHEPHSAIEMNHYEKRYIGRTLKNSIFNHK